MLYYVQLRELSNEIIKIAREIEATGGTEEDLRVRVESVLKAKIWDPLGVLAPKYEYKVRVGTYARHWGRIDALYGLVVFEYKKPGELSKTRVREEALERTKEYIMGLLKEANIRVHIEKIRMHGFTPLIVGILWDGYQVVFVRYNADTSEFRIEPEVGAYDLNPDVLRRIISYVVATYKKKIDARVLAADFGYRSDIIKKNLAIKILYSKLVRPSSKKTLALYNEWLKLTSQAYSISGEELRKIAVDYGFGKKEIEKVDGLKLFFAIQTYYSMIIKVLAAEVAARFYDSAFSSFLERAKKPFLRTILRSYLKG